MSIGTISCPHCLGAGSCCVCHGTRRAVDSDDHLVWLWDYAGCACDACVTVRASRLAAGLVTTFVPSRPAFTPRPALVGPDVAYRPMPTVPVGWLEQRAGVPPGWIRQPCEDCGEPMVTVRDANPGTHKDWTPTLCYVCIKARAYRAGKAKKETAA